jgi:transcriptional regulator with XRE-family HTH domain
VENGESPLTIDLLHKAAKELQTTASKILEEAEIASENFGQNGISIIPERSKTQKKDGTALLVGATLAALFIAAINKK